MWYFHLACFAGVAVLCGAVLCCAVRRSAVSAHTRKNENVPKRLPGGLWGAQVVLSTRECGIYGTWAASGAPILPPQQEVLRGGCCENRVFEVFWSKIGGAEKRILAGVFAQNHDLPSKIEPALRREHDFGPKMTPGASRGPPGGHPAAKSILDGFLIDVRLHFGSHFGAKMDQT